MSTRKHEQPLVKLESSGVANFGTCTFDELITEKATLPLWTFSDIGYASATLSQDPFVVSLSSSSSTAAPSVPFSHARSCPSRAYHSGELSDLPALDSTQWVRTAVTFVLTDEDGAVLVTQRASHMRAFPSRWVVPGGHLERGETFVEAGLREVKEETGLTVEPDSIRLLCMWESNYPIDRTPIRQHIVLYFIASVSSACPHTTLVDGSSRPSVTLDPAEVDTAAWVPVSLLEEVAQGVVASVEESKADGEEEGEAVRTAKADTPIPALSVAGRFSPSSEPDKKPALPAVADHTSVSLSSIRDNMAEGTRFALAVYLDQAKSSP